MIPNVFHIIKISYFFSISVEEGHNNYVISQNLKLVSIISGFKYVLRGSVFVIMAFEIPLLMNGLSFYFRLLDVNLFNVS